MIMKFRTEKDTIGSIKVPFDCLWGAQTQRSIENFKIGKAGSMPIEIVYAFAVLKKAAAHTNHDLGILSLTKRDLISKVCDEILSGKHDNQFPLVIWQTGSGTQTNMNINEVISNRGQIIAGKKLDENKILSPNDDVNMSQSSNDTFPTAMHIAIHKIIVENTIPVFEELKKRFLIRQKNLKESSKLEEPT